MNKLSKKKKSNVKLEVKLEGEVCLPREDENDDAEQILTLQVLFQVKRPDLKRPSTLRIKKGAAGGSVKVSIVFLPGELTVDKVRDAIINRRNPDEVKNGIVSDSTEIRKITEFLSDTNEYVMESKPMKGSLDIMKSCVLNVALLNKNGDLQAPEEIVTTINDDDYY